MKKPPVVFLFAILCLFSTQAFAQDVFESVFAVECISAGGNRSVPIVQTIDRQYSGESTTGLTLQVEYFNPDNGMTHLMKAEMSGAVSMAAESKLFVKAIGEGNTKVEITIDERASALDQRTGMHISEIRINGRKQEYTRLLCKVGLAG